MSFILLQFSVRTKLDSFLGELKLFIVHIQELHFIPYIFPNIQKLVRSIKLFSIRNENSEKNNFKTQKDQLTYFIIGIPVTSKSSSTMKIVFKLSLFL